MLVNEQLKKLRQRLNLSCKEFGQKIGYAQSTVSQAESAIAPYDRGVNHRFVVSVANAFGVNEKWLTRGTGPMFKEEAAERPAAKAEERKDDSSVSIAAEGVNIAIEQCFKLALSLMNKTDKECLCKLAWAVLIACDQEEGVKK